MGPEKHRLSKGISTPRRCSYCQKIMFFKAYRCKHCRYRCHKKCAGHNHRKSHSCHKSYSGEEHWTKVLQANEVNSNVVVLPYHGRHSLHHHCHERCRAQSQSRCAKGASQTKEEPKDSNIFSSLYARFVQWVASARRDSTSSGGRRTPRQNRSRSSSIQSNRSQGHDLLQFLQAQMPEDIDNGKCFHASISSEDSEFSSFHRTSYSSTGSSLTVTSTSTTTSDCQVPWSDTITTNGTLSTGYFSSLTNGANRNCYGWSYKRNLHSNLTFTISCPLKTKRPSVSIPDEPEDRTTVLCATWPPTGRKHYHNHDDDDDVDVEDDDDDDLDGSVFEYDGGEVPEKQKQVLLRESLGEFSIPYSDLKFGECIRVGRRGEIYRGRWHGEVMVHVYHNFTDAEVTKFWEEVSKLSMIRHENVALFMGACIEPPNLAVVTSVRKGVSLYEQVHLKCEKMSMHSRINIVRQIAQGMGYLHAKGIVMNKLNSKNIYLEPKVKLCLMDYSMSEKKYDRHGYGAVARGHLTYLAPEILSTLRVVSPKLVSEASCSVYTDVFAFGTILYELMTGHFPYRGVLPEILIWQICKGNRQPLRHLKCISTLKHLIEGCWRHIPEDRPEFCHISRDLQQNTALHKRHSSSEPEMMSRLGLSKNMFT